MKPERFGRSTPQTIPPAFAAEGVGCPEAATGRLHVSPIEFATTWGTGMLASTNHSLADHNPKIAVEATED